MGRKVRAGIHNIVVQYFVGADMLNADGDIALALPVRCPGDGAKVLDWTVVIENAGTGSENHDMTLEHDLTTNGVALTEVTPVLADAAAETKVTGEGLPFSDQPETVAGMRLQIKNVEAGAITDGATVGGIIRWAL